MFVVRGAGRKVGRQPTYSLTSFLNNVRASGESVIQYAEIHPSLIEPLVGSLWAVMCALSCGLLGRSRPGDVSCTAGGRTRYPFD